MFGTLTFVLAVTAYCIFFLSNSHEREFVWVKLKKRRDSCAYEKICQTANAGDQKFSNKLLRFASSLVQLKLTLCKLQLSQWVCPFMCEFAEQKFMIFFVSFSERTFSQVRRLHQTMKGLETETSTGQHRRE